MKLKKIASTIANGKTLNLQLQDVKEGDTLVQWVGDASVLYRLGNVPYLEKSTLFTIFDIEGNNNNLDYRHNDIPYFEEQTVEFSDNECFLEKTAVEIKFKGITVVGMSGGNGMILIDTKYLRPLLDLDHVEYWRRVDHKGQEFVVAKDGIFVVAVIFVAGRLLNHLFSAYRS